MLGVLIFVNKVSLFRVSIIRVQGWGLELLEAPEP